MGLLQNECVTYNSCCRYPDCLRKKVVAKHHVPAHLYEVIAGVESEGREGLDGCGQLAVLEGRQPLAHVGGECAQAAALWVIPPGLVAGQDQRDTL